MTNRCRSVITSLLAVSSVLCAVACGEPELESANRTSSNLSGEGDPCEALASKHVAAVLHIDRVTKSCYIDACADGWGNANETFTARIPLAEQLRDGCESDIRGAPAVTDRGEIIADGDVCAGNGCDGISFYKRGKGTGHFEVKLLERNLLRADLRARIEVLHDADLTYRISARVGDQSCPLHREAHPYGALIVEEAWFELPDNFARRDNTDVVIDVEFESGNAPDTDGSYSVSVSSTAAYFHDGVPKCF